MANLTSTVPGAFAALLGLITDAASAQDAPIQVFDQALTMAEPASYVCLGITPSGRKPIENHRFTPAALGSFAQNEDYELCGYVTVMQGNVDPITVLTATWNLYQTCVMSPVVENRGTAGNQVLGPDAPNQVEWVLPMEGDYFGTPAEIDGGAAGFQGTVEFCVGVHARLTV